jgi:cytochrome c oxidase cbb3-type subunit 2
MFGIVPRILATAVILCLESVAFDRAVGQVPSGTQPTYDATRGRAAYATYCSACHGTNGEGQPGIYPPIKASGVVTKDDATKHIHIVLDGLRGAKAGGVLYPGPMPPFASILSDVDIADIINYERSSWGNHGKLVAAAQIAAQRSSSKIH